MLIGDGCRFYLFGTYMYFVYTSLTNTIRKEPLSDIWSRGEYRKYWRSQCLGKQGLDDYSLNFLSIHLKIHLHLNRTSPKWPRSCRIQASCFNYSLFSTSSLFTTESCNAFIANSIFHKNRFLKNDWREIEATDEKNVRYMELVREMRSDRNGIGKVCIEDVEGKYMDKTEWSY